MEKRKRIVVNDVLFLNIRIQDGSEAVKAKVAKRLSMLPEQVKNQAARRASELTTPSMLAQKTSSKLLRKIPIIMKEKGLTVDMEEIYREGPYLIFYLRVLHVDPVVLADDMGISGIVQWLLSSVGEGMQRTIEKDYLPKHAISVLEHEIPKMLDQKMKEKKLVVETKVLTDSDAQARYFSSMIKQIREGESRRQTLMRTFKQMSSSFSLDGSSKDLMQAEELVAA